ncbi:MAG: hypothetical protein E2O79_06240 [Caldithrix sp.]|nr:MAG: hypothetical protein E2O79_06240 [Caldithrix sp.]
MDHSISDLFLHVHQTQQLANLHQQNGVYKLAFILYCGAAKSFYLGRSFCKQFVKLVCDLRVIALSHGLPRMEHGFWLLDKRNP